MSWLDFCCLATSRAMPEVAQLLEGPLLPDRACYGRKKMKEEVYICEIPKRRDPFYTLNDTL